MKPYFLVPLIALMTLSLSGYGGNEKGGAGIAENNILFAYWNLEKFIELCQASSGCNVNDDEHKILNQLRENLPKERLTKDQIVFKSEAKEPGFFVVDGLIRMAKTGFKLGDVIYVNTDFLYPVLALNIVGVPPYGRPFDIAQAVSMLVHEMGHHLGIKEHTGLDLIGTKVQTIMRTNTSEVDGGPEERQLIATAIDYGGVSAADLVVRDGNRVLSLTAALKQSLSCPNAKTETRGFWLWNLHWSRYRFKGPNSFIRPLRGRAQLLCGELPNAETSATEFEVELVAQRSKEGPLVWNDGPFVIRQLKQK